MEKHQISLPKGYESKEDDIEQLKNQYLKLAKLTKAVREYVLTHPQVDKQKVVEKFLTEELKTFLSAQQLKLAEQQVREFTFDQTQISQLAPAFESSPNHFLNEVILANYIRAGQLPRLKDAKTEFFLHNGMLTLRLDKENFELLAHILMRTESSPDGFVYDATQDQAATLIMKNIVKQLAVVSAAIKPRDVQHYLDHEAKHYRNKYLFPEYLLEEYRGNKFRGDIRILKEEITAGIEEGLNFTALAIRLYSLDIYNQHNADIKKCRIKLFEAEDVNNDEKEATEQTIAIEKVKIERLSFRKWFLEMLEQASEVMDQYPDIGNDLLSVTPFRHWKLFAEGIATLDIEGIKKNMDIIDKKVESYDYHELKEGLDESDWYREAKRKKFDP